MHATCLDSRVDVVPQNLIGFGEGSISFPISQICYGLTSFLTTLSEHTFSHFDLRVAVYVSVTKHYGEMEYW